MISSQTVYAKAGFICLHLLCAALFCDGIEEFNPPKTVSDGLERLEAIFGKHDPDNTRLFEYRGKIDRQFPAADNVDLRISLGGDQIIQMGNPYLSAGSIVVEVNRITNFSRDAETSAGVKKDHKSSQSYALNRFTFRRTDMNVWIYEERIVSHSLRSSNESHAAMGRVLWLRDGIQLEGTSGFITYIGASAPILGVQQYTYRFTVSGEGDNQKLTRNITANTYRPTKTPTGIELPIPNFQEPIGETILHNLDFSKGVAR